MASRPGPFGFDHLPHEPLGFLELAPAGPRQLTACAIDEEGQHSQARDRPLGTDTQQGERPRKVAASRVNSLGGVFVETLVTVLTQRLG